MRRASETRSSLAGHNAPFRRFLWEVPAAFVHAGRCIGPGGACMYTTGVASMRRGKYTCYDGAHAGAVLVRELGDRRHCSCV